MALNSYDEEALGLNLIAPDEISRHPQWERPKQRLEIAKTGVEQAIETDEATATTWINQQLRRFPENKMPV